MATKKTNEEATFSKEQILSSVAYSHRKDILGALIADDEYISLEEVQNRLDKFMKGQVN
jgi:hypothetical protein